MVKSRNPTYAPNAFVAYANHAAILPGRSVGEFHVMSRMLLWCDSGQGNVTVNGETGILRPGDMMFLPWGHRIRYFNGSKETWRISGIHIIPELPQGAPFEYNVRHVAGQKIIGGRFRKDLNLGGLLSGVCRGHLSYPDPLAHLAEYTVELFIRGNQTEEQARMLARLILREVEYSMLNPQVPVSNLPLPLARICEFIQDGLAQKVTLSDLVNVGGVSPATVCRLFSRHLKMRPVEWINCKRIEKASEMLLSTDLRIGEIADKVGIGDQYYFSKLFTVIKGVPPRKFREQNSSVI